MKRKFLGQVLTAAAFLVASAGVGQAATLIDTSGGLTGAGVTPFGEPDTASYGQTFTVTGADTQLDSFSFRFDDYLNPDTVDFAAYVFAWDGSKASGPQLFASGGLSSSNNGGSDGFEEFVFNTGGLVLSSGMKYVAFLSASNFFDGSSGSSLWELSNSDFYADGEFVFLNHGSDFDAVTQNAWNSISGRDTYFKASFSTPAPVPLPASLPLVLLGVGSLALIRRRQSRA